ncbi:MAG: hypothetical protein JSV96_06995 [Candidatus Aminicenantes bacterium]|nr:MAG: hypothetical protein JSV96_06995 [Candidatus Aminicenantes bacterium]
MKGKKIVFILIGALILFSLSSFAETKKLKRIGLYTLVRIKGEVPTAEVMKILLDKYTGDIKYGFDLAGYGELFLPFLEQIKTASFKEKLLPPGDKLMWMLFRSRGRVKVVEDLEWAGKAPLPVFSFIVKKDYKHYELVMPRPCGNISLRKVEEVIPDAICAIKVSPAKANINDPISVDMSGSQHAKTMEVEIFDSSSTKISTKKLTSDSPKWQTSLSKPGDYTFKAKAFNVKGKSSENPCDAKTHINFPPLCKLECVSCEEYIGSPITFDASGSTDPDGEVRKTEFEIADEAGNIIDKFTDTEMPFAWEKVFEKSGVYAVTAIVTDDFGAISDPARIEAVVKEKSVYFLIEAGPLLARGSHGLYGAGRIGLVLKIVSNKFDFVLSGGGAVAFNGEPWKSFFMANALFNLHAGPVFIGAGAGLTTKVKENRNADGELVGNVGFDFLNNYKSIGSIFFEARAPIGKGRNFSKHHKLMFGFRYIF